MNKIIFITLTIILIFGLLWVVPQTYTATAAAPDNDEFQNARIITSLPYTDTVDTTEATTNPLDPIPPGETPNRSVWYRFTPAANMNVIYDSSDSNYATFLSIYTGDYAGGLTYIDASYSANAQYQMPIPLHQGVTYYLQIIQAESPYPIPEGERAFLKFELFQKPGPANDFFADAMLIESLPFSTTVDLTGAYVEKDEPRPSSPFFACTNTVWYKFVSLVETTIYGTAYSKFGKEMYLYEGDTISEDNWYWAVDGDYETFFYPVEAGQTYYFQFCTFFDNDVEFPFYLTDKPLVEPGFSIGPYDPHEGETVTFCDYSYDPGGSKMVYFWWDLGDGIIREGADPCVTHVFPADGEYLIWHKVQPEIGVPAEMAETITVQSHDLGIAYLKTPYWIKIGKTYQFHVGINSQFASEDAYVYLYLLSKSGKKTIGYQSYYWVSPGQIVDIPFEYTFTEADVKKGMVLFEAEVVLGRYRDRYENNNKAFSFPVLVFGEPDADPGWNLFLPVVNSSH